MKTLRQTIATALNYPSDLIRREYQGADVGSKTFMTVNDGTPVPIGHGNDYKGGFEYITTTYETMVSLNTYGKGAMAMMLTLEAALKTNAILMLFRKNMWSLVRCSQIRPLTTALGGGAEERAQMDIFINHIHRIKAPLGHAETVEISTQKEL